MKLNNKGTLLKNTVMLYILQFSTYLFSFITIPYQTRVLGPVVYGHLGVAVAVMSYIQLFIDFGFLLSATADISQNRDDKDYINRRITSITILKGILAAISLFIMAILCLTVPKFRDSQWLYLIYTLAYVANAFMPDYVYRGIEKMTTITVRTVVIKAFFTVMIFVFLRSPEDYLIVPLLLLIGNVGAVLFAYIHLFKKLGYKFTRVSVREVKNDFFRSLTFFVSRIATTVYTTTNTVILGLIDYSGVTAGYYTSADKILSTAKTACAPISDSLYPYMIKNRDFKLVKKFIFGFMPIILVGCGILFYFATPICTFVFGEEYAPTAPVLRAMVPAIIAILPSYVLGFPTLGAMGLTNYANYSIIAGTVTHILGLIILGFCGSINVFTLAIMSSVSDWVILLFRLFVVIKYKDRLKTPKTV